MYPLELEVRQSAARQQNLLSSRQLWGHVNESLKLMQSYLPKDSTATSSGYAEGGGLYALGLIHLNHGGEITEYLPCQLKVKHGGCLGLGYRYWPL